MKTKNKKKMETIDFLTPQERIMILEDVLKRLEGGNTYGGICAKIEYSAHILFGIWDKAENIIPLCSLKNAKKVTEVAPWADEEGFWWKYDFDKAIYENYDFESRIKFVKWMINSLNKSQWKR